MAPDTGQTSARLSTTLISVILLALLANRICAIDTVKPRASCVHHYLAGIRQSAVLPIQGDTNIVSHVTCLMPEAHDNEAIIRTQIHSGLEKGHRLNGKRSVSFQTLDMLLLRDLVQNSDCHQIVNVEFSNDQPNFIESSNFTLVSLMNESTNISYSEDSPIQKFDFIGPMAGVRHILADSQESPTTVVRAGPLICKQSVVANPDCLVTGKIEIDVETTSNWKYSFAFRTDHTEQGLLILKNADGETIVVRLENDFFIAIDGQQFGVGLLTDSQWHTVTVNTDDAHIQIDNFVKIPIAKLASSRVRLATLTIVIDGEIQLIDPSESKAACGAREGRRIVGEPTTVDFCSGCGCSILGNWYENYPGTQCPHSEEEAYQFTRDADRLSFFLIPNGFELDNQGKVDIRTGLSFKSDSDTGLLLFGFWINDVTRGRFQVFYYGTSLTAVLCQNEEDQLCMACAIERPEGFGHDNWHRVAFYGSEMDFTLVLDGEMCQLAQITHKNNISIAEVYSFPSITQGATVFVGGTYYEKKKSLYQPELIMKYFENTREKVPSIRGCVKDVFAHGRKQDLATIYRKQMEDTLLDVSNIAGYAIEIGCWSCSAPCAKNVRCRPVTPQKQIELRCDCSDVESISDKQGVCEQRKMQPIPLSTEFLGPTPVTIPLDSTRAIVSKVWLKFQLPRKIEDKIVIVEFNSHRENVLRILVSPKGVVQVQFYPHESDLSEAAAAKQLQLNDDRVHLLTIERRTPIGTRYHARKYDVYIDGQHSEIPDVGKGILSNISLPVNSATLEKSSIILHDFGMSYDYDEHYALFHPKNRMHQVDVHSMILPFLYRQPQLVADEALLDPFLWTESPTGVEPSPYGEVVDYQPDAFEPEKIWVSASWVLYSIIITLLLCLLIISCLIFYLVFLRTRSRESTASDKEQMMRRDSPDYMPVKMRYGEEPRDDRSYDGSIGTDETDLQAYRDINSHRVKIYRESMVSILVPGADETTEAAIVLRATPEPSSSSHVIPPRPSDLPFRPEMRRPQYSPDSSEASPAPLVVVEGTEV